MGEIKFLSDVSFYNKDLIYPETNCAYKVVDGDIYSVSLDDAVCGADGEETINNGYAWWNQKTDLFNWEKLLIGQLINLKDNWLVLGQTNT